MADIEITYDYASKQDIYSWFETDDFPTEAQFRATWDSYWHKSESLPMNSISGLVAKFNQTVSKSTFESHLKDEDAHDKTLAKIDASNLLPAHIALWKQTLGVGDLPPNIGTIDYVSPSGEAMIGNAYKKVKDPADGKTYLLKIDGTAIDGDTFGKNVSNSYLTSLPNAGLKLGAIWELDANGFPLRFKNLPDKAADPTVQKKMVILPDGTVGSRDLTDVTVNIPEEFSSTASVASTTITVNHIYPNPVPPPPDYGDQLNAIMMNYKNIIFTPITGSDVDIITPGGFSLDVNKYDPITKRFTLKKTSAMDTSTEDVLRVKTKTAILPQDKDWILKYEVFDYSAGNEGMQCFHLLQADNIIRQSVNTANIAYQGLSLVLPNGAYSTGNVSNSPSHMILFIKVGSVINIQIYRAGSVIFTSISAFSEMGDYRPCMYLNKNYAEYNKTLTVSMSYKILN